MKTLALHCDSSSLCAAIAELSQLAQRFPERVQAFLNAADCPPELAGLDLGFLVTVTADEQGIALQPSNRFLHFLSAMRAGDFDRLAVE